MNTGNVRKLCCHLACQPDEKFDMRHVFSKHGAFALPEHRDTRLREFLSQPGAAASLAGHAFVVFGSSALLALHLSVEQAYGLFFPDSDGSGKPGHITREHAVRTLTRLVETGEVDWDASAPVRTSWFRRTASAVSAFLKRRRAP